MAIIITAIRNQMLHTKDQETIRREYEAKKYEYDHYMAFGRAFMNFCSRR